MKIIEPLAELIDDINAADVYSKIERCGRVCYQSQPSPAIVINEGDFSQEEIAKISKDIQPPKTMEPPAAEFVRMLIKRGHESVLEHVSLTFHIICDRAIMAELTRHRLASFTVESTRYVEYDELAYIKPEFWGGYRENSTAHRALEQVEKSYRALIELGEPPELTRAVLPLCTKTELYITANLREWRHILKLRTAKAAHPQMRVVAGQILDIFRKKLPAIVEDI